MTDAATEMNLLIDGVSSQCQMSLLEAPLMGGAELNNMLWGLAKRLKKIAPFLNNHTELDWALMEQWSLFQLVAKDKIGHGWSWSSTLRQTLILSFL